MQQKWLYALITATLLASCSTNNINKQQAKDHKIASNLDKPILFHFGDVQPFAKSSAYQLPSIAIKNGIADIRPPSLVLPVIPNSTAHYNDDRAVILFPAHLSNIYSWQQIQRVLTETGIHYQSTQNNQLETEWAESLRGDETGVTVRYHIESFLKQNIAVIAVQTMGINKQGKVHSPTAEEKQRYSIDLLNLIVANINQAYLAQQKSFSQNSQISKLSSTLGTDNNGRYALLVDAPYDQTWVNLLAKMPLLGFELTKESSQSQGVKLVNYKPQDNVIWQKLKVSPTPLKRGDYQVQVGIFHNQSAVVITDKKGKPLTTSQVQPVYSALKQLLAN